MKLGTMILAAAGAATLAGCVAVPAYEPAPAYYSSAPAYYYPAPGPAVSFYYSNRPYYHRWHRW